MLCENMRKSRNKDIPITANSVFAVNYRDLFVAFCLAINVLLSPVSFVCLSIYPLLQIVLQKTILNLKHLPLIIFRYPSNLYFLRDPNLTV